MKFKSRKDPFFTILGLGLTGLLIGILMNNLFSNGIEKYHFMWTDVFLLAMASFLVWLGLDTRYELTSTILKYRSGPIRGQININEIHEIIEGKTMWSGLKPATARNGLIIKYAKFNEIYISPKTNDSFIKKITTLNSSIKITRK